MNEETPLAVFAAEISGNPHCFDRGSTAGMLLVAAICCLEQEETRKMHISGDCFCSRQAHTG